MSTTSLQKASRTLSSSLFSATDIFVLPAGLLLITAISHLLVRFIHNNIVNFTSARFWPISIFWPRIPTLENFLMLTVLVSIFYYLVKYLLRTKYKITHVILAGIILVLGTNLLQGWENGFVTPISGTGVSWTNALVSPITIPEEWQQIESWSQGTQLYHDAIKVEDPLYFLRHYQQIQPDLSLHSSVHPPGAILIIYSLYKIIADPAFISIALALISIFLHPDNL